MNKSNGAMIPTSNTMYFPLSIYYLLEILLVAFIAFNKVTFSSISTVCEIYVNSTSNQIVEAFLGDRDCCYLHHCSRSICSLEPEQLEPMFWYVPETSLFCSLQVRFLLKM